MASTIETTAEQDVSQQSKEPLDNSTMNSVWQEAPTKILLSLLDDLQPKEGNTVPLKNRTNMWQKIQEKLAEEGYSFTVAQVHGRYHWLKRRYHQTKLHNSKTPRKRQACHFESELDKVFSNGRGIYPEFFLDSDSVEGTVFIQPDISSTSSDSDSSPAVKRLRCSESVREQILKTIDDIKKENAEYRAKLLQCLENKEDIEKERNVLLKKLFEKLI